MGNFYINKTCNIKIYLISDLVLKYTIIIIVDDLIADMLCTELSIQDRKQNIYIIFITRS